MTIVLLIMIIILTRTQSYKKPDDDRNWRCSHDYTTQCSLLPTWTPVTCDRGYIAPARTWSSHSAHSSQHHVQTHPPHLGSRLAKYRIWWEDIYLKISIYSKYLSIYRDGCVLGCVTEGGGDCLLHVRHQHRGQLRRPHLGRGGALPGENIANNVCTLTLLNNEHFCAV